MNNIILVTGGSGAPLDVMRAEAAASLLARMEALDGDGERNSGGGMPVPEAVAKLEGRLSYEIRKDGITAHYIPSMEAKKQLTDDSVNGKWDAGIVKKQQKSIRLTQGALFRFPLENGEGTVEAFITDWSPFPAAAAIAVHKDHPAAGGRKTEDADYFTGSFVRHPLTGDLLPVFVADWVKPEFGTGAVIINPAHNQADLEFARKVGLPVRFGLVPGEVTAQPSTWPDAPVVRTGHTTKTGRFDHLTPEEAVKAYFEELHTAGHADRFTDIGIGSYPLLEGEAGTSGFQRAALRPSRLLKEICGMDGTDGSVIVSQAAEAGNALLFARCLFYDLYGKALVPEQVVLVQKVEGTKQSEDADGADMEAMRLAVLVQAQNGQPAVLKKQIMEQAERFLKNHREMKEAYGSAVPEEKDTGAGAYAKVKEALRGNDYQKAFTALYALQKTLYQGMGKGPVSLQALKRYFALAYVLLGDECPDGMTVSGEWKDL